jgi:hypothetical protein
MRTCIAKWTLIALALWSPADGIEKVVFEADEIVVGGTQVSNANVTLDLRSGASPTLHARAPKLGVLRDFALDCTDVVIKEPVFACKAAHVVAKGGPTGGIDAHAFAAYNTDAGSLKFGLDRLSVAGGHVWMDGSLVNKQWSVQGAATALQAAPLRALIKPWFAIPEALTVNGALGAQLRASGRADEIRFDATVRTRDFGFSNEEGTVVAERVAASLTARGLQSPKGLTVDVLVNGSLGQTLVGPVLLDFGTNNLSLAARGTLKNQAFQLDGITVAQKDLLYAHGDGLVTLGEKPSLTRAHMQIDGLVLPAAYTSFAQLTLATTDFGTLQTSGRLSGSVDIENNRPKSLAVKLDGLNLQDTKGKFSMSDVRGDVHWIDDAKASVPASFVSWRQGTAYGLSGGESRVDLRAQGFNVELTRESRLPIFDGAVLIRSLALRDAGQPSAELQFDAQIEPISMPLLSKAFGWPELQGELSGRIPGLSYRNRELTVQGDLSASVFDGTIAGRNFRLRDPLGPWPRLFADVTARGLDLELVTRTFPIGNITGRLNTDIKGLELFNWSPVAFDARLYTTPGDRSKHLISQKAVTSISNVSGGGGVTAALQSGVLRFFDDFRYDRIGLTCRLQKDVCVMGGIEPSGMGYYIVKGKGLPRIDIIGNQGRVDWPLLVSQISAGMRSNNIIVR